MSTQSIQWAPSGDPLAGVPTQVMRLLASPEGKTYGYGYGPGWTMMFGSEHGDIAVQPGQWIHRNDDGTITVTDEAPAHV